MTSAPRGLAALGWDAAWAAHAPPATAPGAVPARVVLESKLMYRVWLSVAGAPPSDAPPSEPPPAAAAAAALPSPERAAAAAEAAAVPGLGEGLTETWAEVAGRLRHRMAGRLQHAAAGRPQDRAAGRPQDSAAGRPQDRAAGRPQDSAAGRPQDSAVAQAAFPAVGDWVWVEPAAGRGTARIEGVLPRRTVLSRTAAGETGAAQVLAANVDVAFVTTSLNRDFNPRRLERYLTLVRAGGVTPVVLLTKADLAEAAQAAAALAAVAEACPGTAVLALSARTGAGLAMLEPYLGAGRTLVLLGSSGVGKSTLVNRLLGTDALAVREIRASDSRGRHTTTMRQMLRLPGGALLIDTPGMRELQLTGGSGAGLDAAFPEIEALAPGCRFRDCRHGAEPGCAVRAAVDAGRLAPERLAAYLKLSQERAAAARRDDRALEAQQQQQAKRVTTAQKRKPQDEP